MESGKKQFNRKSSIANVDSQRLPPCKLSGGHEDGGDVAVFGAGLDDLPAVVAHGVQFLAGGDVAEEVAVFGVGDDAVFVGDADEEAQVIEGAVG